MTPPARLRPHRRAVTQSLDARLDLVGLDNELGCESNPLVGGSALKDVRLIVVQLAAVAHVQRHLRFCNCGNSHTTRQNNVVQSFIRGTPATAQGCKVLSNVAPNIRSRPI